MPKRTDIRKILLIGSGPIVIGQACEFDYSGTQALKALREEGYSVVLVNSNPATIMTDPDFSDRVYIEPLVPEAVEEIIRKERPDALLPTMGGQTALNLTMELHKRGILSKYNVEILGAKPEVIHRAEDRDTFKSTMDQIGVASAKSKVARSLEDAKKIAAEFGFPVVLRPSFTLGGEGGGIVHSVEELLEKTERALFLSPSHDVLIEESLLGWKEFELEVVRDTKDNVIIICSIENFDPMGVHTGDSITVAPAQTLTDREYQRLRDYSVRIIRAIGVETGGSNIQYAVNPKDGRVVVIEMNPRVSRSSALASKATGFPIARVAAKLAVGYTLDELNNDITKTTPCSFEPSIDYVVVKVPRFDFEKFRPTSSVLGTQMKSVGEVMALGRSFEEALGKAIAGLENSTPWLFPLTSHHEKLDYKTAHSMRLWSVAKAIVEGDQIEEISKVTGIDLWFLDRLKNHLSKLDLRSKWPISEDSLRALKQSGWSDRAIAIAFKTNEAEIRAARKSAQIHAGFLSVDTCAAEFEAKTPYFYSTYLSASDLPATPAPKVMILGGGPNRIGQGIEFDYCCVHASMALRELGIQSIMVNCNPETVSTDFDMSDILYFEPLTPEHVIAIAEREKPLGAIVQFGGQTPLKIAKALEQAGIPILGTSVNSIDTAEDREKCDILVKQLAPLGLEQPAATTAKNRNEAIQKAKQLGFPVVVRPSYVLGGRGMRIVHTEEMLEQWIDEALSLSEEHPILIDRFLNRATEVDVDALCDGEEVFIAGLMEHIEEAGIHSGDSACSLPQIDLPRSVCDRIRTYTRELAKKLKVVGLMNAQFAVLGDHIYLLEVNPRASRTTPFVAKAVGLPVVKIATKLMLGKKLRELGIHADLDADLTAYNVKAPVFPFHKFPGVDVLLGPEMKSTGEVMGRAMRFEAAYAKALLAAGTKLPRSGNVFLSIRNEDKAEVLVLAKKLHELGFKIWATKGTSEFLNTYSLDVQSINKVAEGSPHCVEAIRDGKFDLVINTTSDEQAIKDSFSIRRAALERKIPYSTVLTSARAMILGIEEIRQRELEALPLPKKA